MSREKLPHVRNFLVAGVAGTPLIGGPLSVILDKYLPDYLQEKNEQLLSELHQAFESLDNAVKLDFDNNRFYSAFLKCQRYYLESEGKEKLACFKNMIVNSAVSTKFGSSKEELFMSWITEFTLDHVILLREFALKYNGILDENRDMFHLAQKLFPSEERSYLFCLTQTLAEKHIVVHGRGYIEKVVENDDSQKTTWRLSELGMEFFEFVSPPNSTKV